MTPRPKTARRTSAPPLNRFKNPRTPDWEVVSFWSWVQLTPGMGTFAPTW